VIRFGIWIAVAAYSADRVVKWVGIEWLDLPARSFVLTPFFNLVMVWNSGVSFGLLQNDSDLGRWLLIAFQVTVVLAFLLWLGRAHNRLLAAALGLVIGGAAGNITDRLAWGVVADFFDFHLGPWHFPVFNVADTAIFLGFVLIVVDSLSTRRQRAI
jgi:signal peptidase II